MPLLGAPRHPLCPHYSRYCLVPVLLPPPACLLSWVAVRSPESGLQRYLWDEQVAGQLAAPSGSREAGGGGGWGGKSWWEGGLEVLSGHTISSSHSTTWAPSSVCPAWRPAVGGGRQDPPSKALPRHLSARGRPDRTSHPRGSALASPFAGTGPHGICLVLGSRVPLARWSNDCFPFSRAHSVFGSRGLGLSWVGRAVLAGRRLASWTPRT